MKTELKEIFLDYKEFKPRWSCLQFSYWPLEGLWRGSKIYVTSCQTHTHTQSNEIIIWIDWMVNKKNNLVFVNIFLKLVI